MRGQLPLLIIDRDEQCIDGLVKCIDGLVKGIDGLVFQVQEQNRQLKEALESETRKPVVGSMAVSHEMLDFKKMFAETKAHAKVWYARFHPLSLHIPINRLSPSNLS